ncbi:hypothetical protein BCR43DRAFT_446018 [Syncephalastrum racemosum]|uniref:Globin domain-containing protein n=1 Tax=Syncephalastrum racemosum TaxID=13706 RepID=A0A1X2H2S4_SYNRA|nr:hypothetical protein BCR43DRAFT_446018 [Syncephalastrum racemosum]
MSLISSSATTVIVGPPPPPTAAQLKVIRRSWELVSDTRWPNEPQTMSPCQAFSIAFYDALFALDRTIESALSNIILQGKALSGILSHLVRTRVVLDEAKSIDETHFARKLQAIGATYIEFNVQPYFFDLVGPALISALQRRLKEEYTATIEDAWLTAQHYASYHLKIGLETQLAHWSADSPFSTTDQNKTKGSCLIQ